jgi:uncharacterized protein (TIGR02391 family)
MSTKNVFNSDFFLNATLEQVAESVLKFIYEHFGTNKFTIHELMMKISTSDSYLKHKMDYNKRIGNSWTFLESNYLIVRYIDRYAGIEWNSHNEERELGERALSLDLDSDISTYISSFRINKSFLHDVLQNNVWSLWENGNYINAITESMKWVEIKVREKSGLLPSDTSTSLMKKAFSVDRGKLKLSNFNESDISSKSEQESVMFLFSGAVGYYRNPAIHREIELPSSNEAMEVILFANNLLPILDNLIHTQ